MMIIVNGIERPVHKVYRESGEIYYYDLQDGGAVYQLGNLWFVKEHGNPIARQIVMRVEFVDDPEENA